MHGRTLGRLLIVGASLIVASLPEVSANHGHWIDHYLGADMIRCCGERDCSRVHARIIEQSAKSVTVEVNGVVMTIPAEALHVSEDRDDYWCAIRIDEPLSGTNTRCVFIAAGS